MSVVDSNGYFLSDFRVLVWCRSEPDAPSGTPVILTRILEEIPPGQASVVCERATPRERRRQVSLQHSVVRWTPWPFRRGARIKAVLKYALFPVQLVFGLSLALLFRPSALLTVYFDNLWVLSALLIARICRLPVLFYFHDGYTESATSRGGLEGWMAPRIERLCARYGVFVALTRNLQESLSRRHGLEVELVRHVAGGPGSARCELEQERPRGKGIVAFSGAIYDNNALLLRSMAIACARRHLQFLVFTDCTREHLEEFGILQSTTKVAFESDGKRLVTALAESDLLYLPLAFESGEAVARESLRLAFPTKTLDYLQAGVPILVHCPSDYEVFRFLEQHSAAWLLADGADEALDKWLVRWTLEEMAPASPESVSAAIEEFSPARNFGSLRRAYKSAIAGRHPERPSDDRLPT